MSRTARIFVNGAPRDTSAANIADFARELAQPPEMLLIEHNGVALHRSEWASTPICDTDRLEILRVTAGG